MGDASAVVPTRQFLFQLHRAVARSNAAPGIHRICGDRLVGLVVRRTFVDEPPIARGIPRISGNVFQNAPVNLARPDVGPGVTAADGPADPSLERKSVLEHLTVTTTALVETLPIVVLWWSN
jgi:hypothetical protein